MKAKPSPGDKNLCLPQSQMIYTFPLHKAQP